MEKRWACLAASFVFLRGAAAADIQVPIDILPGEARNLVDTEGPSPVSVALLATDSFDPRAVEPTSLLLMGAPTVKNADGLDHLLRDVNGDGRDDLLVWFAARELRIGDDDVVARLEGRTKDGTGVSGRDAVRTLAAARREASLRVDTIAERVPPVTASIERLADGAFAVLATADLDPSRIVLDSIRIDGLPTGRTKDGDVASLTDVNGDGRTDLVVTSRDPGARGSAFSALTADGHEVTGSTQESAARPPVEIVPTELPPTDQVQNQFPGAITIGDGAPPIVASPYPATITVSGVAGVISKLRVTLSGLNHECPRDLDIMLVGPTGQNIVLMSDVAECSGGLLTLTFDDFAPTTVPLSSLIVGGGSYRPSNQGLGDAFPAPAPAPSQASALSVFNGTNPNGDWKLYVVDDATFHTGSIQGGWSLDIVTMAQFCTSPTPSLIPAGAPGTTSGPAENYGSWVFVSGLPQRLSKVSVTMKGLTHPRPEDLDVLLVSPSGGKVLLMASAGGSAPFTDNDITFDDITTIAIPDTGGNYGSTTYRPSIYASPTFAAPAPGPFYFDTLRGLLSWDPNGTWRLYVQDHAAGAGSTGVLSEGWCLNVTTIAATESCQLQAMTIPQGAPATTAGPAVPYPSTLNVTGTTGRIEKMQVKLLGLTHTYPDDLDILLQAPSGKSIWLMSDAGGSGDVVNQNVTFDTGFSGVNDLPDEGPVGPGPYSPAFYEPGDSNPAPAPGSASDTSLYEEAPNGLWKLWVNDDAGADVGSIAGWCMNFSLFESYHSHCSTGGNFLTIPSASNQSSGPAGPYPWNAQVTEQGTVIGRLAVRIYSLTHTYPGDLDVLLVGPTGMKILVMSDAGSQFDVNNVDLLFDDYAAAPLPADAQITSGTWQPTDVVSIDSDVFPAPAPPGPYGTNLNAFDGTDPQGTWQLYVNDDAGGDIGSAMQWCLDIYPTFPTAEVTNVHWKDKTTMEWDAPANAWGYSIRRGTAADMGKLLTAEIDSCNGVGTYAQTVQAPSVPAPGTLQWYIVLGSNGAGFPEGTAGRARLGSAETARILDSSPGCNAPF
jgi:subtilisin-like proprotein convertase family protein